MASVLDNICISNVVFCFSCSLLSCLWLFTMTSLNLACSARIRTWLVFDCCSVWAWSCGAFYNALACTFAPLMGLSEYDSSALVSVSNCVWMDASEFSDFLHRTGIFCWMCLSPKWYVLPFAHSKSSYMLFQIVFFSHQLKWMSMGFISLSVCFFLFSQSLAPTVLLEIICQQNYLNVTLCQYSAPPHARTNNQISHQQFHKKCCICGASELETTWSN